MAGILVRTLFAVALVLTGPTWMETAVSAQAESHRTVLVIHWGPEEFPATPVVNAAIEETLTSASDPPIDYYSEYLETDRFPGELASSALVDYIRQKYRGRRIDLVIAIADPALDFVLEHREELFPGAPIVYSGVGTPDTIDRGEQAGFTAVLRGVAYAATLDLALALHPSTEQVFVLAKSADAQTSESARAELSSFSRRVTLTYLNADTLPRLLETVRSAPPRSLVLYIWYTQDDPGPVMNSVDIVRLVAGASPVPVYSVIDLHIGAGVVGGMVRDTRQTAARVGQLARQILEGTRPDTIPIENARLRPVFDVRQLRRWGIEPSRLPPGSDIRFRVASVWETYRSLTIAIVVVIAAQSLLIAGLLAQRTRLRRADDTIRTREATLRTSYQRSRMLAGRLITAQEATRTTIARDLHDDVCQELVGLSMAVSTLRRSPDLVRHAQTQEALTQLQDRTLDIVNGVRRLSHDLHPATLQLLGLAAALRTHCVEVEKRHDVQVGFVTWGEIGPMHPDVALFLFRIAQEALRNGIVHGEARRLGVSLSAASGDYLDLIIADDGRGFDVEAVRRDGGGLGLVSIEERVHLVGGEVVISSRPRQGTTIHVRVPPSGPRPSTIKAVPASEHPSVVTSEAEPI